MPTIAPVDSERPVCEGRPLDDAVGVVNISVDVVGRGVRVVLAEGRGAGEGEAR